jgi:hypothetical protein
VLAADAPSVTDWMQGWGNVLGVVLSSVAVIFTGLLFRHEVRVRREEKADSGAAQARLVVGRITEISRVHDDSTTEPTDGPGHAAVWKVRNYSSMPVFNVEVWINKRFSFDEPHVDFLNTEEKHDLVEDELIGVTVPLDPIDEEYPGCTFDLDKYEIIVTFTDSNGFVWTRSNFNEPQREWYRHSYRRNVLREFLWAWMPKKVRSKRHQIQWRTGRTWAVFKVKMRVATPEAVKRYDDSPPF